MGPLISGVLEEEPLANAVPASARQAAAASEPSERLYRVDTTPTSGLSKLRSFMILSPLAAAAAVL